MPLGEGRICAVSGCASEEVLSFKALPNCPLALDFLDRLWVQSGASTRERPVLPPQRPDVQELCSPLIRCWHTLDAR